MKNVTEIQDKISYLYYQLQSMDYKTSKYADGEYTEVQWQNIVKERKILREQIRSLEKQLEEV